MHNIEHHDVPPATGTREPFHTVLRPITPPLYHINQLNILIAVTPRPEYVQPSIIGGFFPGYVPD